MPGIKKDRTSVIVVIIAWICCFPLGIYLLHRRLTEDKTESNKNSGIVKVFGWIMTAMGIMYLFIGIYANGQGEIEDGTSLFVIMFIVSLFFLVPGIILLRGARKMKVLGERYDKYYRIINRGITNIQNIANEIKIPAAIVSRQLTEMIDSYFLPGTYVDLKLGEVILPGKINKSVVNNQAVTKGRSKAINCRHCGANSVVVEGIASNCEYCGLPLIY